MSVKGEAPIVNIRYREWDAQITIDNYLCDDESIFISVVGDTLSTCGHSDRQTGVIVYDDCDVVPVKLEKAIYKAVKKLQKGLISSGARNTSFVQRAL